jgi:hypothetical protein
MHTSKNIDRRSALKSVLAAVASLAAWRTRDASAAALEEKDPQALTLARRRQKESHVSTRANLRQLLVVGWQRRRGNASLQSVSR